MTATATAPVAALPAAGGDADRPRNLVATGTALVCSGATMLFVALMAAYLELRGHARVWPPKEVKLDEYLGNMLVITMLLGSLAAEWAVSAVRRGEKRQANAAFAITIGFGIAFANLLSYSASRAGYGAGSHAYGTIVAAIALSVGVVVAVAVGFIALTVFRVAGGQVGADNPDQARAAGWMWHYATVATIVAWYVVVVRK